MRALLEAWEDTKAWRQKMRALLEAGEGSEAVAATRPQVWERSLGSLHTLAELEAWVHRAPYALWDLDVQEASWKEPALTLEEVQSFFASPALSQVRSLKICGVYHKGRAIPSLVACRHLSALRSLTVCGLEPDEVRMLAASSVLEHVTHLSLDGGYYGDEGVHALVTSPHLSRLESLHVRHSDVSEEGVEMIARLSGLRSLNLSENQCSSSAIPRLLLQHASFHGLESLGLGWVGLYTREAEPLWSVPFTRLRSLDLSHNGLYRLEPLLQATWFGRLERLDLSGTQIAADQLRELQDGLCRSRIRGLGLTNVIDHLESMEEVHRWKDALVALLCSPAAARLEELWVDDNELQDHHIEAIAGSRFLSNVRVLRLGPQALSERAQHALEAARTLRPGAWEIYDRYSNTSQ